MMIFLGAIVLLALLIFFVSELGHKPYGWDDTAF
jgi:hypothetical protein